MTTTKPCETCGHGDPNQVLAIIEAVDSLRATMSRSNLAVALQGAEVRQVNLGGRDTKAATSAGRLMGWSLRETAGAQATVYLRDGLDDTGAIVAAIELAPNESTRDSYFPGGLSYGAGLYVDVAAGAVEGAVYLGGAA